MNLSQWWHDVRFAVRLAFRQPWLTGAAVLTLSLGVGANTAVVSAIRTVLLNPLGLRDADRLMTLRVRFEKLGLRHAEDSGVEFREAQAMTDVFSATAAMEGRAWTLQSNGSAARVMGRAVTPEFFRVFGQQPALGRFFSPEDRESVVLSHPFWKAEFGSDASVLGRALLLDGTPYRIVGVTSPAFHFPANAQVWTPLTLSPKRLLERGNNMSLAVFTRLRDGVPPAQAVDRMQRHVAAVKDPAAAEGRELVNLGYGIELDPLAEYIGGELRRPLLLVWAAALILLLTACANVAGLLLIRTSSRVREMAVRLALGATRWQILRQLSIESLLLGAMGGVAGLLVAAYAVAFAGRLPAPGRELLELVTLDRPLLFYGIALSLGSALVFGLAPALQLLRQSQAASMTRSRRHGFQDLFVIGQVAGALVLLTGTGLLLRSLWSVQAVRPGFDPHHLMTAYLIRPKDASDFRDRLLPALRSMPGVEAAALAYPLPFTGGGLTSLFLIRNRQPRPGEPAWHAEAYMVSPGYLRTMGIPLLHGRDFAAADIAKSPRVCLIDARTAARFFPKQDPLGQEIAMYGGWARIVGVTGVIRGTTLEEDSRPVIYYALPQAPFFEQEGIVARAAGSASIAGAVREAVRQADAGVPLFSMKTMDERIGESLGMRRVFLSLLAVFGLITLLLAAVGLHGMMGQLVGERTAEIGIRMAIGAEPRRILAEFLRRGAILGVVGLALGLLAAAFTQQFLRGLLYEVQPLDPVTFLGASALVLAALAVAGWWPALRASQIDPRDALRHE